jgi:hypothetical protein
MRARAVAGFLLACLEESVLYFPKNFTYLRLVIKVV